MDDGWNLQALLPVLRAALANFSITDLVLIAVNSLLLLFSQPIINLFSHGETRNEVQKRRLHLFRVINLMILLLVLFYSLFLPLASHSWVTRVLSSLLVAYLGYLGFHLINYLIKRRFGREREVGGSKVIAETYNSRLLSLLTAIFVFIVVLISVVQIFGFDSLLQAGGVIGFIGVFLALTQSSWAPDIISGLIILNSKLVEEGDVIEFSDGERITGMVFKTKVFHTEILNLINNHRIMLQNSRLRQQTIHNLSKFASAKGLREVLSFKIGYGVEEAAVRAMFEAAAEEAIQDPDIPFDEGMEVDVKPVEAGDFAVLWNLYYHTKDVRHLHRTRQLFLGLILKHAREAGIGLATPMQCELTGSGGPVAAPLTGDRHAQTAGETDTGAPQPGAGSGPAVGPAGPLLRR